MANWIVINMPIIGTCDNNYNKYTPNSMCFKTCVQLYLFERLHQFKMTSPDECATIAKFNL